MPSKKLTPEEAQKARTKFYEFFDSLPVVQRMFINEYGAKPLLFWLDLRKQGRGVSLRNFEETLRRSRGLSPTSPIVDEYGPPK